MISTRPAALPDDQAGQELPAVGGRDPSRSLIRWGGLAGVAGGLLLAVGAASEATQRGDQDPKLAIVALVLIGLGMVGLERLLTARGQSAGIPLVVGFIGIGLVAAQHAFDVWQLFVGILGVLAASVALGLKARKTKALPAWVSTSLIAASALLVLGNTDGWGQWLWLPFGIGWMATGAALWSAGSKRGATALAPVAAHSITTPFEPVALEAEGAAFRPVLTLARVEGRRLITHPIFLASPFVSVVMVAGFSAPPLVTVAVLLLSSLAYFTVAEGTLLVANLGASRSRRHGADELYATLPVSARSRATASLLSLGWAAGAGLVVNVAAGVYLSLHGPLPVTGDFGPTPDPLSFVLFQGPALLVLFGALGIFLARWIPTATVGPLAVVGMFMIEIPFIWSRAALKWLAPLGLLAPFDSEVPNQTADPPGLMGWHVLYLLGLSVVLGALASLRHGRNRASMIALLGGVVLTGIGGTLQVLVAA